MTKRMQIALGIEMAKRQIKSFPQLEKATGVKERTGRTIGVHTQVRTLCDLAEGLDCEPAAFLTLFEEYDKRTETPR